MNEEVKDVMRHYDALKQAQLLALDANDLRERGRRLWKAGLPRGASTGWPSVDHHYTVAPGQFTVITGWPGSGKSEWLDAVLMNLARQGWRFALYSPENQPEEVHLAKMAEKFLGLPFGDGPSDRMSLEEFDEAVDSMREWFGFMAPTIDTERVVFGMEQILLGAELRFRALGVWHSKENMRGLVVDPWNELEHQRPNHWSETEYISATLSMVRAWARTHRVHVWIVAHPQKQRRNDAGELPVPRPDMISGSQHWWNKSDNCVTVWRDFDNPDTTDVQIHVQKVRFKHVGRPGKITLRYERVTGRYFEKPPELKEVKNARKPYAD